MKEELEAIEQYMDIIIEFAVNYGFQVLAASIEYSNGCTMDDALGADVHKRSGGHLSVGGDSQCAQTVIVIWAGMIWDYHATGEDQAGGIWVGGK